MWSDSPISRLVHAYNVVNSLSLSLAALHRSPIYVFHAILKFTQFRDCVMQCPAFPRLSHELEACKSKALFAESAKIYPLEKYPLYGNMEQ